ncbi:hypothetical protein HOK22_02195, partial [Candidatus Peregrinibacteria bacterium]|nr:hypothetical protein [Candidatus Peregrinibacteria bacterium]
PSGFTEHYYTEWDDGLGKEKIALFIVVSIGSTQVPGAEIGKEAFQLLQDHFLDDLTGDPYDRFENALREVNLCITDKEKELGVSFVPNMNIICGVIQKDMLFLSQRGEAQGYLVRKRHVSSITDGLYDSKNKDDLFQNIASGVLEVGDSVILVTGQLVQYVTPNDLSKIFSEQSLNEAGKELKDLLHADVEEQLALLSFEILEKAEPVIKLEKMEAKGVVEDIMDVEDKVVEKERKIEKSLNVLRSWLDKKEKFVFVKRLRDVPRDRLLKMAVALTVVVVVGIVGLSLTTGKNRVISSMEGKLSLAEENITQAATRGSFDKDEAALLLDEAELMAVEVLNSGYLAGRASQVIDDISEQRDFLDNVIRIDDELKLLVDLGGSLGNSSLVGVLPYDDKHFLYTGNEVYEVLIDEAQTPVVIDASKRAVSASYFPDRDNVVVLMNGGDLIEYTEGNSQFADTVDVEWENGREVRTYSNKVYILDSEDGQIWRYQRGTTAFGSSQAYIDAEALDLTGAVSFAIDGNIWILNSDGSITKVLSGDEVPFNVKKSPTGGFAGATKIYTELEIPQLYVLDPANDRLLVFDKSSKTEDITYSVQYLFDDLRGELQDLYVDKDRDVIMLVTDQALYELGF